MQRLDRAVLRKILADLAEPSVRGHSVDLGQGGRRRVHNSVENAERMLNSPDFKAGWHECLEQFRVHLEFLARGDTKELRKYSGYTTKSNNTSHMRKGRDHADEA